MKSIYKITLLFLLFPLITSANIDEKKHEKNKKIKKEFSANKDAKVSINNKYGNINITTWDKNRVEIEVTITVKGDDLERVENMLDNIDVDFESSSNFVSAKTTLEKERKSWSFWSKSKNLSYKINYNIKMPRTNDVDLNNDYGSIFLDDLSGRASINCDYGKISVGELSADNNNINLDYCSSSSISYMKSGNINVDYSKITIEESENIKVNTDYSTLKLEISGHTDRSGLDSLNIRLSKERAESVYTYLVENGADKKRLSHKGYGSAIPIATNKYKWGRDKNRRVEIKIVDK